MNEPSPVFRLPSVQDDADFGPGAVALDAIACIVPARVERNSSLTEPESGDPVQIKSAGVTILLQSGASFNVPLKQGVTPAEVIADWSQHVLEWERWKRNLPDPLAREDR